MAELVRVDGVQDLTGLHVDDHIGIGRAVAPAAATTVALAAGRFRRRGERDENRGCNPGQCCNSDELPAPGPDATHHARPSPFTWSLSLGPARPQRDRRTTVPDARRTELRGG